MAKLRITGNETISFEGRIYVRPCGRGLVIESPACNYGWDLDDIFEEGKYYNVTITARQEPE